MAEKKLKNKKSKANYSFIIALEEVIFDIPERSRKILKSRFGVSSGLSKTLEEIGQEYKITRERVRQIIKEILRKIGLKRGHQNFQEVKSKIEFTISQKSGIISKKELAENLTGNDLRERGALNVFLEVMGGLIQKPEDGKTGHIVALSSFDFSNWEETIETAEKILSDYGDVLHSEDLFKKILKVKEINSESLYHYLAVSKRIGKNNFGKWGLAHWKEINPKVIWQKTYLVLKEEKKPLHFRQIAALIDIHYPGKRKTHPQTVHNELIKNQHFVLVGRGTYALSVWGYKKGTVKEVLEEILKKNEKPMKKNEIIDNVMKKRRVKKSTVLINLNNFFLRVGKDAYTVEKR